MLTVRCDEQLPVGAARLGEPAAWDALFKRYQAPLYVYVFELVRDQQESLDIVQETFVNAVRHIANLRVDARFGSWLFGIAHQKCIQRWRRQDRDERLLELQAGLPIEPVSDPGELLIRKEREEQVLRLVDQLSAPQRAVVLLHFIEEFSLEEIAEITHAELGTVKSRLHYAKRTLRKLLEGI
jgi:RNA polymerase sigma-70 factor (ECF subfamily)